MVKNPPVKAGDSRDVGSIPWEGSLEINPKEMATHSSILSWRIPWTEEPVDRGATVHRIEQSWHD